MMLLPLILIAIFVYLSFNTSDRERHFKYGVQYKPDSALDILSKRYANGEISEEEYLKRKSLLQQH